MNGNSPRSSAFRRVKLFIFFKSLIINAHNQSNLHKCEYAYVKVGLFNPLFLQVSYILHTPETFANNLLFYSYRLTQSPVIFTFWATNTQDAAIGLTCQITYLIFLADVKQALRKCSMHLL